MREILRIVYIILTPIYPLVTAVREYRYIQLKMSAIDTTFIKVLKCHFQVHFELIRYWNEYWEKELTQTNNEETK
jgi:hypothetical protein